MYVSHILMYYVSTARALQDQALSAPVICPLRPCILPADCKLIIPSDPEDPCACPTCALDCSTVLCALPTHCPNPVTPEGQCCPVCPVTSKFPIGDDAIAVSMGNHMDWSEIWE